MTFKILRETEVDLIQNSTGPKHHLVCKKGVPIAICRTCFGIEF